MKVYVVSAGDRASSVVGVFTTKQKAQDVVDGMVSRGHDANDINLEEFELDSVT